VQSRGPGDGDGRGAVDGEAGGEEWAFHGRVNPEAHTSIGEHRRPLIFQRPSVKQVATETSALLWATEATSGHSAEDAFAALAASSVAGCASFPAC
jgi:hypothetical protein